MNQAEQAAYERGVRDTLECGAAAAACPPILVPAADQAPTLAQLADAVALVDPLRLAILRPFDASEAMSVKEAAAIADRSESCVREWAERFGIGRLVVGSLLISRPALAMLLDGDVLALAAYLQGQRREIVRPYFERGGVGKAA